MVHIKKDRIALVTGAGSGIGRGTAIALCGAGWQVVLAGRRSVELSATAEACPKGRTLAITADVTDAGSVARLFEQTRAHYGRLDLLFNNAGISGPGKPFESLTLADWQQVINTNVTGAFLCAREAFRMMKDQVPGGGRIINNGSISAHVPRPHSAPYTTSKHAITGLTRSVALDGRPYHIACGQIDIGNANSTMAGKMQEGILQPDGSVRSEPVMEIADVARAVVHMAELPPEANIPFMTIMASNMPYIGRG